MHSLQYARLLRRTFGMRLDFQSRACPPFGRRDLIGQAANMNTRD
jgi:hypothetical protein